MCPLERITLPYRTEMDRGVLLCRLERTRPRGRGGQMHHVRAIGLIVWACMLLSLASARAARAADSLTYHVTMTPDAGNLPQYVCIVQQLAQHAVGILLTHPAGGGPAGA